MCSLFAVDKGEEKEEQRKFAEKTAPEKKICDMFMRHIWIYFPTQFNIHTYNILF